MTLPLPPFDPAACRAALQAGLYLWIASIPLLGAGLGADVWLRRAGRSAATACTALRLAVLGVALLLPALPFAAFLPSGGEPDGAAPSRAIRRNLSAWSEPDRLDRAGDAARTVVPAAAAEGTAERGWRRQRTDGVAPVWYVVAGAVWAGGTLALPLGLAASAG